MQYTLADAIYSGEVPHMQNMQMQRGFEAICLKMINSIGHLMGRLKCMNS